MYRISKTTRILKALDPADLARQVNECGTGDFPEDLHGQFFVSMEGLICQNVVPSPRIDEYRLIVAKDLDDLELQEQNLIALGFDFFLGTIMWNAKYLQWMSRLNDAGLTVRDAVVKLHTDQAAAIYQAAREDELQLVEGVRAVLGMKPVANDAAFEVTFPFPFPIRLS